MDFQQKNIVLLKQIISYQIWMKILSEKASEVQD